MAGTFEGKRGLVLGVANKRSIAWAIARELAAGGASLAFTYQGERIEPNGARAGRLGRAPLVTECDVRSDEDVARVFAEVGDTFGGELDLLVHSVAFAAAEDLEGRFTDTPRDRFWLAVDVSAYSLVACARAAEPLMEKAGGGSILTMTYLGGERAVPHYNVMGVAKATLDACVRYLAWDLGQKNIRVNAVSAGPVRTLAARSIAGFTTMEDIVEERSPLHRHITADDVGAAGAFLLGDGAAQRDRHDAVRRQRLPRDGDVYLGSAAVATWPIRRRPAGRRRSESSPARSPRARPSRRGRLRRRSGHRARRRRASPPAPPSFRRGQRSNAAAPAPTWSRSAGPIGTAAAAGARAEQEQREWEREADPERPEEEEEATARRSQQALDQPHASAEAASRWSWTHPAAEPEAQGALASGKARQDEQQARGGERPRQRRP